MIGEALRRVFWLVPTLAVITVSAFWLVSHSVGRASARDVDLPLFVNRDPKGVMARAIAAADHVAAGGAEAENAAKDLARIGGAGLPYVVPHLDALPPEGRTRVALALSPVARRMRVGKHEEYARRDTSVLFWTRFWQDHAIDFRPIVVKRALRRAIERPSALRRAEVLAFDTFALAEITDAMASMNPERDRPKLVALTSLAAAITGNDWTLREAATPAEARGIVEKWQRWWAADHEWFVPFQGVPRLIAMIRETRYGRWAGQLARGGLGQLDDGEQAADVLIAGARITLRLILGGILGGYFVGAALGAIAAIRRRDMDVLFSVLALSSTAIPSAALAWWISRQNGTLGATALMAGITGAFVFFHQRAAQRDEMGRDWVRTQRAFGIPPHRAFLHVLRMTSVPVIARLGTDLPLVMTTAFVVEHAFSLRGLGPTTVVAVNEGNVAWLMVLALSTAVLVGLCQIASDFALRVVDPRIQVVVSEHRGRIR